MTAEGDADVEALRAEFPGWTFRARWQTANSGPEWRALLARRGTVTLTARDAAGLREKIRAAIREAGG